MEKFLASINWHLLWLWVWFLLGMGVYMLKRAYYLVTGPNPIASNYKQFVERCWIPLLVRGFVDSLFFWALFIPEFVPRALLYLGWTDFAFVVLLVTEYAVFAAAFGLLIDVIADFALSKIPFLKDWLPQMPGPLPKNSTPQPPVV